MQQSQPISIAGAGPAGLTAAITLARAGHRIIVHERRPDVGMRFCDDYQALENWTSEEDVLDTIRRLGIQPDFYCQPITRLSSYGPRSAAQVTFAEPHAYLIRRGAKPGSLDSALKRQALDLGIDIRFESVLTEAETDIVAVGPRQACAIAVGCVFDTDMNEQAAVLLDNRLAPKGYAYLLVAEGRGTLATVLYDQFSAGKACLERTIDRVQNLVGLTMRNVQHFGGYGTFDLTRPLVSGRRRYVGEAAGLQDNLFGFGIRQAMVSGHLAARSIIEGSQYDRLCRTSLGGQLRASLINRYWYEFMGQPGYDLLVRLSSRARNQRNFWSRIYTKPMLRLLLYPLARLAIRRPR
ncbi:MAG: NAD(P)/FAD-dependent oxidoreductase [Nitrospira sp. LK70]|nr:NAD(P)/FAD-dependent oxidoreductase [Nitrospira sp. LK70]